MREETPIDASIFTTSFKSLELLSGQGDGGLMAGLDDLSGLF